MSKTTAPRRILKNVSSLSSALLMSVGVATQVNAAIEGDVFDLNGKPISQAMVMANAKNGADVITVFTDTKGHYRFPDSAQLISKPRARHLGYDQLSASGNRIIMAPATNVADIAPASAWLAPFAEHEMSNFVVNCVNCHQVPTFEVRNFAKLIDQQETPDKEGARRQSWNAIGTYMNQMWNEEIARGTPGLDPKHSSAYFIGDVPGIADLMAKHFKGPMQQLDSYDYGAPLIVNAKTTIREYEIERPNAIREALLLDGDLWIADVSSERMFTVDIATGEKQVQDVPVDLPMGPHTLHPAKDRSLWIAPMYNGIVAYRDIKNEKWTVWNLKGQNGEGLGIHDLSFGSDHQLLKDKQGRVWFSDIGNGAVGWFNPETSETKIYPAPQPESRAHAPALLYGLAMTDDQREVCYAQLGNGVIGCFDIETETYVDKLALPDIHSGPRRITMGDDGVLWVALFGSGQIAAYDTNTHKLIDIYDLPDRGSAPYAVTWDPVRKMVWVPTSNTDVIYRFNPADNSFGVLPLPRQRTLLRMVDVDPETGALITSYANIIEQVQGPRMALVIEPGDDAYPKKLNFKGEK